MEKKEGGEYFVLKFKINEKGGVGYKESLWLKLKEIKE